jgi:hypothetical protein
VDPVAIADGLFTEGRYREAAVVYRSLLEQDPAIAGGDRVLFGLALSQLALPAEGSQRLEAGALLGRLVQEHPESAYRPVAETILEWRSEAERLRQQLEELKRIDLRQPDDPLP